MWLYSVLGLVVFSFYYIYFENKQRKVLKKYSKNVISSNSDILSENFIADDGKSSIKLYLLNKNENTLKAITKDAKDIKLNELIFSDFQIFKNYIENSNLNIKIFTHKRTMYLFYPVLSENNDSKFVVFEKNKLNFDDLMGLQTKRYSH